MKRTAVLIVEDEPLIRMDTADFLEGCGFRVFEAANAGQALDILEAEASIGILFTDIHMPGSMNGLELASAVQERWPSIRIALTSGHTIINRARVPGGGVFFPKPYTHDDVVSVFRNFVYSVNAPPEQHNGQERSPST